MPGMFKPTAGIVQKKIMKPTAGVVVGKPFMNPSKVAPPRVAPPMVGRPTLGRRKGIVRALGGRLGGY